MEIDVLSNRTSLIENVGCGNGFAGVVENGEGRYLITSNGEVEHVHGYSNLKRVTNLPEANIYPIVRVGDNICMFPHEGGRVFELSVQKESLKKESIFGNEKLKKGFWRTVQAITTDQNCVYLCIGNSGYLVHTDTLFKNVQYKKLMLKQEDVEVITQSIQRDIRDSVLVKEGVCISLFDMIDAANKDILGTEDRETGSKIFRCLVKGDRR